MAATVGATVAGQAGMSWIVAIRFACRRLAPCVGLLCLVMVQAAHASERPLHGVALVVGQSGYASLTALTNPANDARQIAGLLSELGFEVTTVLDADTRRLERSLRRFVEDAAEADVALLYYAGHGIEAGGENFLVPVDLDLAPAGTAIDGLVPVGTLLSELRDAAPVSIVLLDACRDNPLPPGSTIAHEGAPVAVGADGGLGLPRGARALVQAGPETLGAVIGFAAEPGRAALDGKAGGNSPYAAALLKHLGAGGAAFGDVMTMVSEEVYLRTAGRQLPWTNASLRRLLYFGRDVEPDDGDEQALREGRRALLLSIAATPRETRRMVEDIASQKDVPLDALYGMLSLLEVDMRGDDLSAQLASGAARLRDIIDRRDVQLREDPEIVRLSDLADRAEREGAIALALDFRRRASLRADAIDGALDDAEADIGRRRLELAATYRGYADTAVLNFQFAVAAGRYADAYEQAVGRDDVMAYEIKVSQAMALADHGTYSGETAAFEASIAAYRQAIDIGSSAPDARRDASLKGNIAIVMTGLGARSGDVRWLEEAARINEEIAIELTRDAYPVDWAYTRLNLGGLYLALAERLGGPRHLADALQAYSDAAEIMTRQAMPAQWAGIRMSVGNVHARLAEYADREAELERSIEAIEDALAIWTPERELAYWAMAQGNLATSLGALGAHRRDPDLLRRAIRAYAASLEYTPREFMATSWAGTMNNLAGAYLELGTIENDPSQYFLAVQAYRSAREVFTRDTNPVTYALMLGNEARALLFGARAIDDEAALGLAASAIEEAVGVMRGIGHEIGEARMLSIQGDIEQERGRRSGDRDLLRLARRAYERARDIYAGKGMAQVGQEYWQRQIEAIDTELAR